MKKRIVTVAASIAFLLAGCSSSPASVGLKTVVTEKEFATVATDNKSMNSLLAVDLASSLPLMGNNKVGLRLLPKFEMSSSTTSESTSGETSNDSLTSEATSQTAPSETISSEVINASASTSQTDPTDHQDEDKIVSMLNSLDLFNAKDLNFSIAEVKSTNADYAYQTDISYTLLDGKTSLYSLFYNSAKQENEVSEDEKETEIKIEGISLVDDVQYTFDLLSETKTSKEENETEVTFRLKQDETNFVEVKNSLELEENEKELEFSYRKVSGGLEETYYEVSFENDDEDQEEETELETLDYEYEIDSYVKDGLNLIEVEEKTKATGAKKEYTFQRTVEEIDGKAVVSYVPYVK
ncbi:MAG: hypothetical protein LKJ88_05570 [Bacilli bacterium]|jgi:hypothetical protein|nr:hypothetical protein [Bacilli bacterium]